jgi:hypothetical protein
MFIKEKINLLSFFPCLKITTNIESIMTINKNITNNMYLSVQFSLNFITFAF